MSGMMRYMETPLVISLLVLLGLMFGSFAGASVWRLRSRQLIEDRREGEAVDPKELKKLQPLSKSTLRSDRSRCLHCGHILAWYDLLPLVSWVTLRGRCRYCRTPIGKFEPLMELGTAGVFVLSYLLWPMSLEVPVGLLTFLLWLVAVVMLVILFAYDMKWFLLPDQVMFPLIGVSAVVAVVQASAADNVLSALMSLGGALMILSGLYYFLWLISKGQWVGFGDVKLGIALALLLVDWQLALVALFSANLLGSLVVIPGMMLGKTGRKSHVPFGPFLIAGAMVAMLIGRGIVDAYAAMIF